MRQIPLTDKQAFTLIELLVVVVIILIMATMLLPALEQARDRANEIACAGNMGQIGTATMIYLADNDRVFPDHRRDSGGNQLLTTHTNWFDLLAVNVSNSDATFRCPSRRYWHSSVTPDTKLEIITKTIPGTYNSGSHRIPYGYNGFWFGVSRYAANQNPIGAELGRAFTRMSDVASASSTLIFSDSKLKSGDVWSQSIWYSNLVDEGISDIHRGTGSNVTFVDGHVRWHSVVEVNLSATPWDHWSPNPDRWR